MRARTITTTTRRRRRARRRLIALALGVCALAVPASAGAFLVDGGHKSAAAVSAYESSGSGGSPGAGSIIVLRRDGSEAEPFVADLGSRYSSVNAITGAPAGEPTLVSGPPASATDGFQWADAALGAGAAMVLVALAGAVLFTVRGRPGVSPSASTS